MRKDGQVPDCFGMFVHGNCCSTPTRVMNSSKAQISVNIGTASRPGDTRLSLGLAVCHPIPSCPARRRCVVPSLCTLHMAKLRDACASELQSRIYLSLGLVCGTQGGHKWRLLTRCDDSRLNGLNLHSILGCPSLTRLARGTGTITRQHELHDLDMQSSPLCPGQGLVGSGCLAYWTC